MEVGVGSGIAEQDGFGFRCRRRIGRCDRAHACREGAAVAVAEVVSESTASIPVGRYGDPQEYADVVAFLASQRASYITGSVIRVDGGLIPSI